MNTLHNAQRRALSNSDMQLTPIGLGAWAIGGPWKFGWGRQDDAASIKTIHAALDAGVNWIDTAAVYGLGHSEEIVGKALKSTTAKPYVFTKCSMTWDADGEIIRSLRGPSVRAELEASLKRLGIDCIDLYQIHWPNPDAEIEEGWETMAQLQKEGKIRRLGVSNFSVEQLRRCGAIAPVTSNQPPLNLIRQDVTKDVLPYCADNGIGTIVYSPMASGLLTGTMTAARVAAMDASDWRKQAEAFNEPALSRNLGLAALLAEIGADHGVGAGEVAIAWTLVQRGVTAAIVGMRSPEQVAGVIRGGTITLRPQDLDRINTYVRTNLQTT